MGEWLLLPVNIWCFCSCFPCPSSLVIFTFFLCSCSVLFFLICCTCSFSYPPSLFLCTRFLFCLLRPFYRVVTFSLSQVNSKGARYIFSFPFYYSAQGGVAGEAKGTIWPLHTHSRTHTEESEKARWINKLP